MRALCRSFGASYAVAEMILDAPVLVSKTIRKHMRLWDTDHPVAAQITCSSVDNSVLAAQTLVEMGYEAVELNFACPVGKLVRRGRGGAFLKEPARSLEYLEAVRRAIPLEVPVSLKLRTGWDHITRKARRLLPDRGRRGATGCRRYHHSRPDRQAGLQGFRRLGRLAAVGKFVGNATCLLGSGDVMKAQDVLRMLDATGMHGVSIARGAIGKPWIFRQVRDMMEGREPFSPGYIEQGGIIRRHFELSMAVSGHEERTSRHLRKFGIYYSKFHPNAKHVVRLAFLAVRNAGEYNAVVDQWYGKDGQPADLPPPEPQESAASEAQDVPMAEPGPLGDQ